MTDSDPTPPTRDRLAVAGMIVVGVAAAVLSFQTWVQLAIAVGFSAHWTFDSPFDPTVHITIRIAWLLPMAVDCYALTVTRIWLRAVAGSRVARYAKYNAFGAIGLSVAGQAAYHAFAAAGIQSTDLWWFAILIGGIPPLQLGLVVELYTLLNREEADNAEARRNQRRSRMAEPTPTRAVRVTEAVPVAQSAAATPTPAVTAPTERPVRQRPESRPEPSEVTQLDGRDDESLMTAIRPFVESFVARNGRAPGQQVTREAIREATGVGVGTKRAGELADRVARQLAEPEVDSDPLDRDRELVAVG